MKNKCTGGVGSIKNIYICQLPIDISQIDLMSEFDNEDAKEINERFGIECVILSTEMYLKVQKIKELIKDCERQAEEYYQELDNEEMGYAELQKVEAYKNAISIITGGKPILKL